MYLLVIVQMVQIFFTCIQVRNHLEFRSIVRVRIFNTRYHIHIKYSNPYIQYPIPYLYPNTQIHIFNTWCHICIQILKSIYMMSISIGNLSDIVDHYPYSNLNPRNIASISILSNIVDHYLYLNLHPRNIIVICVSDCLHSYLEHLQ